MIKKLLLVLTLLISSALVASPALAAPGAPGPADPPARQDAPGQQTAPGLQNAPQQQPAPAPQNRPAAPPAQQNAPGQQATPGQPAAPYAPGQLKAPGQPAAPFAPGQQGQGPPAAAAPDVAQAPDQVEICHANEGGGFSLITIPAPALNGHGGHGGDIIPPFDDFAGLNWDAAGQAIYAAGCDADAEPGTDPNANAKVTLCHANNGTFEYSLITVSINSVINGAGHDGHDGDIIPPFAYEGGSYAGKNWTEGMALTTRADCVPGIAGGPIEPGAGEFPVGMGPLSSTVGMGPLSSIPASAAVLRPTSDDSRDGFLPSTGGAALWLLLLGGVATVVGLFALRARRSRVVVPGAPE